MPFLTEPFPHQLEEWRRSAGMDYRGILWEQGTGKTKLTIDTAHSMYQAGEIDGVLVLAPNGVHDNWVTDELPAHMPPPYRAVAYRTNRATTVWHQRELKALLGYEGLAVLAMSYDGFMTMRRKKGKDSPWRGREWAMEFLRRRKALWVCDESQRIKTPSAKRTQAVVNVAKRHRLKRILSGTPVTNSPFDIYPQLRFLDEGIWGREGFASYEAFKTFFGVFEQMIRLDSGRVMAEAEATPGELAEATGRFKRVVRYKNLDRLAAIVDKYCNRVTKDEVLDLPPKLYSKRYFELSPEQQRVYDEIKNNMITLLDSGELVTTRGVIVQLLRLHQITCGYLPSDDCVNMNVFKENPRLKCLVDALEDVPGQAIIWGRFHQDIDQIMEHFRRKAERERTPMEAVQYDGRTEQDDRVRARKGFQEGRFKYFVGNPAAAGVGLTLHAASEVIYYANSFNLEHRLQSEDRAHRIGQTKSVKYTDLVARGTVDSRIVSSLRVKFDIASRITGDEVRKWI